MATEIANKRSFAPRWAMFHGPKPDRWLEVAALILTQQRRMEPWVPRGEFLVVGTPSLQQTVCFFEVMAFTDPQRTAGHRVWCRQQYTAQNRYRLYVVH